MSNHETFTYKIRVRKSGQATITIPKSVVELLKLRNYDILRVTVEVALRGKEDPSYVSIPDQIIAFLRELGELPGGISYETIYGFNPDRAPRTVRADVRELIQGGWLVPHADDRKMYRRFVFIDLDATKKKGDG